MTTFDRSVVAGAPQHCLCELRTLVNVLTAKDGGKASKASKTSKANIVNMS